MGHRQEGHTGQGPLPKFRGWASLLFVWTMDRLLKLQNAAILVWRCRLSVHYWDLSLAVVGGWGCLLCILSTLRLLLPLLYDGSSSPFICGLEQGLANSSSWATSNPLSVFMQVLLEYSHAHSWIVNKFVYELFMAAFAVELTGKLTKNARPWSLKYLLSGWPLTEEVLALTQNHPCIHSFISRQRWDRPLCRMQGS